VLLGVSPVAAQQSAADDAVPLDNRYLPADAMVIIDVDVASAIDSPEMRLMPIEVASAWCWENFGVPLEDVRTLRVVISAPGQQGPRFAVIVEVSRDVELSQLEGTQLAGDAMQMENRRVQLLSAGAEIGVTQAGPRTLVGGTLDYLSPVLAAEQGAGALAEVVDGLRRIRNVMVVAVTEPVREPLLRLADQAPPGAPPPLLDLFEIADLAEGLVMATDAGLQSRIILVALAENEENAGEIEQILKNGLVLLRDMSVAQSMQQIRGDGPVPAALRSYAQRISEEIVGMLQPKRAGKRVVIELDNPTALMTPGVMVGLLLPAVQAARAAARRMGTSNNMKQILLGMFNYESVHRRFPTDITDEEGQPLLSWRVAILPYIEQQELYQRFRLDEPWDSEHNLPLLDQMPEVFAAPGMIVAPNHTVYQVPDGEGMIFESRETAPLRTVTDGLSNTIALFESGAEDATPWTRPGSVEIDPEDPQAALGRQRPQVFVVGMGDGAVRSLPQTVDLETLWALLTRGGGEVVEWPEL
jgi:hypothetical protein